MPRDVRYRKSFTAQNGVYWRLDIIPGDNTVFNYTSAGTVTLGDETILNISDIEIGYRDELCFGMPEYAPLEVEFNLDTIPNDLKTYITVGYKEGTETSDLIASNICILWSSTDNVTFTPIWIGVQTPQLVQEITISSNDRAVSKVTFQPIHTAVLTRCKWAFLNKYFDDDDVTFFKPFSDFKQNEVYTHLDYVDINPEPTPPYVAQELPSHQMVINNDFGNDEAEDNFYIYPYPLKTIFEVIRREIQATFKYITRQATSVVRTSADKTNDYFSWEYDRYIGTGGVFKVRKALNSISDYYDRLGDYIPFDQLFIPFVIDPGPSTTLTKSEFVSYSDCNQTAGGIFNSNDTGSFPSQYKTFTEFFTNLAEFCCSKMLISFTWTDKIKMKFDVFAGLERTNNTITTTMNLFENSASEELTAEIGYICSSTEVGNSKSVVAPEIPPQSPVLSDLAKSQTFSIKNCVFNWDTNISDSNPKDNFRPTTGTFTYVYIDDIESAANLRGYRYAYQGPVPCTTLFYAQGLFKITEYVQIGDTTKATSDNNIYYETDNFLADSMKYDIYTYISGVLYYPRYIQIYRWLTKWHFLTGTAVQLNKLFSKILTNPKNWLVRDAEIYHLEDLDLGMPNLLIGHRFENAPPDKFQDYLGLPSEGVITKVSYNVGSGLYKLTAFNSGFLQDL